MSRLVRMSVAVLFAAVILSAPTVRASLDETPLEFSIALGAEYTDNRDSVEVDEESTADFFVRPKISSDLDWVNTVLDFHYLLSYRYRTDPNDFQNDSEFHHDFGARLDHDFTPRSAITIEELFNVTDDPKIEESGTTVRSDQSYLMNRIRAKYSYRLRPLTALDLGGRHRVKMYDEEEVASSSDESSWEADGGVAHRLTPDLLFQAGVKYGEFSYDDVVDVERDFGRTSLIGGVERRFSPHLEGRLYGGVQMLDYVDPELDDDTGPYLNAVLKVRTIPSTRFTGEITHQFRESFVYPYASQQQTDFRVAVDWDAVEDITLSLGFVYRLGDYEAASAEATDEDFVTDVHDGTEEDMDVRAQAVYRLNDTLTTRAYYLLEDVDSDVGYSFTRNTVGLFVHKIF